MVTITDLGRITPHLRVAKERERTRQPVSGATVLLTHAHYLSAARFERRIMMPYVPLGPLYVAAALREKGYKVRFFDTTFAAGITAFERELATVRPALVGIYALETTRGNAFDMMRACRLLGIPVVVGGPDPSADPELYLQRGASIVVAGEGEETMVAIMETLRKGRTKFTDIPGVHTAQGHGPERRPELSLEAIPFPARDLVDHGPYFAAWRRHHGITSMQMQVSRGCPYRCSWCAKPVTGEALRLRSAASVAEEMFFLKMIYNPDQLYFTDDVFGYDREWVERFRAEVLRKKARIPFECVLRVGRVDAGLLRLLKEAGCFRIWYGAASGSPKVLDRLHMDFVVDDITKAAQLTRAAGIEVGMTLTLGHPAESVEDIELTRNLVRAARPDRCGVNVMYPFKGTPFYREVQHDLLPIWHMERFENDNILTYRTRYSQNYYDLARTLIGTEARVLARPDAGLVDKIKYGVIRMGYRIMSSGLR